jgi:hypothetical protein
VYPNFTTTLNALLSGAVDAILVAGCYVENAIAQGLLAPGVLRLYQPPGLPSTDTSCPISAPGLPNEMFSVHRSVPTEVSLNGQSQNHVLPMCTS